MTDGPGPQRWVAVSGTPASGTSLVAGVLAALGADLGPAGAGPAGWLPAPADDADGALDGRDAALVALHAELRGQGGAADTVPAGGLRAWLATRRQRSAAPLLGWCDPLGVVVADAWADACPDLAWVLAYRPPWDVEGDPAAGPEPVASWSAHARGVLDLLDAAPGRCLLVEAAAVVEDPGGLASALAARLDLPLEGGPGGIAARARLAVARRHRRGALGRRAEREPVAKLLAAVPEEARRLGAELDARAHLRADGVAPSPGAWAARALDGIRVRTPSAREAGGSPRVLVVTPCHDDGDLLVDAVASVADLEADVHHVVVDDASTDARTVAVLDELRRRGVEVLTAARPGAGGARNTAIEAHDLPVVVPLDADNLLRPDGVARALAELDDEPGWDVAYGDAAWFGDQHGRWEVGAFDRDRLLRGNYIDCCAAFRRSAWERAGGYDEGLPGGLCADWALWLSMVDAGCGFAHLPEVTFDYRVRSGSLGRRMEDPQVRAEVFRHIIDRHHELYATHVATVVTDVLAALDDAQAARREAEAELAVLREVADTRARALDVVHDADRSTVDEAVARARRAEAMAVAAEAEAADLHDRLGEVTDALAVARRAVATVDRRLAEAVVDRRAAEAEAAAARRQAEAVAAAAEGDRQELAAIHASAAWRWLRWPRRAWSAARGRSPG